MPTVTGVSPNTGNTAGGTSVTITGTGLTGASAVKFGTFSAINYTVNSATSISVTSPAGSAGTVDVTVSAPGGTSATSSADQFTYESVPTVTAVSPNTALLAGGTSVTITGTNFSGVSGVMFGATAATSYNYGSATSMTAIAPPGSAGTVDITVTTPDGTSATSSADQFSFTTVPTVTAVSPLSGLPSGGASVTITAPISPAPPQSGSAPLRQALSPSTRRPRSPSAPRLRPPAPSMSQSSRRAEPAPALAPTSSLMRSPRQASMPPSPARRPMSRPTRATSRPGSAGASRQTTAAPSPATRSLRPTRPLPSTAERIV